MKRLVAVLVLCAASACAGKMHTARAGQPKSVRVSCDRTGSFSFVLHPDGEQGTFTMPACDAQCRACGQQCSYVVTDQ